MENDKKVSRRFKDFSHLFISSKDGKSKPTIAQQSVLSVKQSESSNIKPIFCITSFNNINDRVSLIAKIAADLANVGKKVLLVDADFSLPRLSQKINSGSSFSVMNILLAENDFGFYDHPNSDIKVIIIDADISDISSIEMKKRIFLKKFFRYSEEIADVILISTPVIVNMRMTDSFIKAGSQFVILTPRERSELITAYRLIKTINRINNDVEFGIISNSVEEGEIADDSFKILERIIRKFLDKELKNYGSNKTNLGKDDPLLVKKIKSGTEVSKNILEMLEIVERNQINQKHNYNLTEKLFS